MDLPEEKKDYYEILGVSRDETQRGIQESFRKLAHRLHPDRVGPEGTSTFQDILGAYEVLSDPQKRREYDRGLRDRTQDPDWTIPVSVRRSARTRRDRVRGPRGDTNPEPLVARRRAEPLRPGWTTSSGFDEPDVIVTVSPDEAARGLSLRLRLPLLRACEACLGTGGGWLGLCGSCGGAGAARIDEELVCRLPGGLRDHTIIDYPVPLPPPIGLGGPPRLRIGIRILGG